MWGDCGVVIQGKMFQFAENVAAMAKSQEVKEVIILSGLDLGKYDQRHPLKYSATISVHV